MSLKTLNFYLKQFAFSSKDDLADFIKFSNSFKVEFEKNKGEKTFLFEVDPLKDKSYINNICRFFLLRGSRLNWSFLTSIEVVKEFVNSDSDFVSFFTSFDVLFLTRYKNSFQTKRDEELFNSLIEIREVGNLITIIFYNGSLNIRGNS